MLKLRFCGNIKYFLTFQEHPGCFSKKKYYLSV